MAADIPALDRLISEKLSRVEEIGQMQLVTGGSKVLFAGVGTMLGPLYCQYSEKNIELISFY